MIRPLRRRHLRSMVALAVVLPPLFGIALGARRSAPRLAALRGGLAEARGAWEQMGDWSPLEGAIAGRGRAVAGPPGRGVELELSADQDLPDVLVYWSPSTPQSAVDDGWLLGVAPDARRFDYRLPAGAPEARGRVVLYSLGHHQVVASVELRWP